MDAGSQPLKTPLDLGPCPYCGGDQVVRGLCLNQNAEAGRIGLLYKAGGIFRGTEDLLADLCGTCGSVRRVYVRELGRTWVTS